MARFRSPEAAEIWKLCFNRICCAVLDMGSDISTGIPLGFPSRFVVAAVSVSDGKMGLCFGGSGGSRFEVDGVMVA